MRVAVHVVSILLVGLTLAPPPSAAASLTETPLCGGMTPVRSRWLKFGDEAIVLRVATSHCKFEPEGTVPCYFTSVIEAHHGTFIPGTTSITDATSKHSTLVMWDPSRTSQLMLGHASDWLVSWVAVAGPHCGTTAKGSTGWKRGIDLDGGGGGSAVALYADIDAAEAGFEETPTYLSSLHGMWDFEKDSATSASRVRGVFTNTVHAPTSKGFRVYIVVSASAVNDTDSATGADAGGDVDFVGDAEKLGWHVSWVGLPRDKTAVSGHAPGLTNAALQQTDLDGDADRSAPGSWNTYGEWPRTGAPKGVMGLDSWHSNPDAEFGGAAAALLGSVFMRVDCSGAHFDTIPAYVAAVSSPSKEFACVGAQVLNSPTPRGFNIYLGRLFAGFDRVLPKSNVGCELDTHASSQLKVSYVGYRVAGLGSTAGATHVAAEGGGCAHIKLHGQQEGALMSNRMGTYIRQAYQYNSHAVYMYASKVWGNAFLYFDFTPDGKTFWVVGPKVGSNSVNIYALTTAHYPNKVTVDWMVADAANNRFTVAPQIECDCGLAVEKPRLGECEDIVLAGQKRGGPMFHRMGRYMLQAELYNDKPTYRNVTKRWGAAYLYFESTPDGKRYWVVGPKIGSKGVNLYAMDEAMAPDRIVADWMVADPKDNTFTVSASIEARCAHGSRYGFEHVSDFAGTVLRVDAELHAHSKESFSDAEGAVLATHVAAVLGLPKGDVTVKQVQEWASKVVVEFRVHVRNPRVAEAAIAALSISEFSTRVANHVGTAIGGEPIVGLQFSRPTLVAGEDHHTSGIGGFMLVAVLAATAAIVWVQSRQKSRKHQSIGQRRKYRSLATADAVEEEEGGLLAGDSNRDIEGGSGSTASTALERMDSIEEQR